MSIWSEDDNKDDQRKVRPPKYRHVSDMTMLVEPGKTRSIAIRVLYGALQFG